MKFSGKIGFWIKDIQTRPGSYKPCIIEKPYTGDVMNNIRRFQSGETQQNENLVVSNKLSIVSNLYLQENWPSIKYVLWNNTKWKVTSVDVGAYPRVVLELGGVYNGTTSAT